MRGGARNYNKAEKKWLHDHFWDYESYKELTDAFNETFGACRNADCINALCYKLGLSKQKRCEVTDEEMSWVKENLSVYKSTPRFYSAYCDKFGGSARDLRGFTSLLQRRFPSWHPDRYFTDEQLAWLAEQARAIDGRSAGQINEEFYQKFGVKHHTKSIYKKLKDFGAVYDALERSEVVRNTRTNRLPVGREYINPSTGVILIKTEKGLEYKSRAVWEKEVGPIPKDGMIIFLDGDRTNCDISNLACVNKKIFIRVACGGFYGLGRLTEAVVDIEKTKEVIRVEEARLRKNM